TFGKPTTDVVRPTNINQASYQVSVRLKVYEQLGGYGYGHICGGAVISETLVVTAAQCTLNTAVLPLAYRNPDDFTLVMGSSFLQEKNAYVLQYDVEAVLPFPAFNSTSLENDIALLLIKGYIPWEWPTVRPISLRTTAVEPNTTCRIGGWGKLSRQQRDMSDVLLSAPIPTISYANCSKNYGFIPEGMLCAGYAQGGVDACEGNAGGPLECSGQLAGIVSWGIGCGYAGYPGVYTNVSYYSQWIQNVNTSK
ncbi:PREDICTED: trypsin eta-like, partial [Rhagoletis zephyria]|uniref:trypsin eta-like n=1 Tax=Rhagoletis zephyria TaxID=28612 RepID=UPI0008119E9F